jgi:hypothetical protein
MRFLQKLHLKEWGFVPLTSSPSPLFLITPDSNKETSTHKEYILVVPIKTEPAAVHVLAKWNIKAQCEGTGELA